MADAAQPRKRHRRQQKDSEDGAHTPVAAAAQPSSDAPQDFPRGRAAAPAAPAPGTASASASGSGDFLFGTARPSGAGGRKTKAKRARSAASQKTSRAVAQSSGDGLEAVAERGMMVPKKVHLLTYKRLSVGMSMLGQVVEVKETGITLGLPDNLTGHVSFMDLSDRHHASDDIDDAEDSGATPVSQLVQVGDLLRCSVVNLRRTHGHSHVDASLRPSLLNAALSAKSLVPGLGVAGTVDSVEDHGYTVDLGIDGTSGFLPFEDASSKDWPIGRPVECVVQQSKKRKASKRVVHLTALAAEVNSAKVRDFPGLSLSTLQAGMLVSAQVASVVSTGAVLTFLRHFVGVVDMFHLRDGAASSGGESISPNDKVSARILYVDPVNKTIGLTLKPRLARNEGLDLSSSVPVGSTFEDALVKRVDPVLGICLELPGQPDCTGFAHLSRISDEHIDKIGKEYTVGTRHTCRVVGHSPMDCVANVSLQDSTLSAPFLRIEDIEVGAAVSGTVLSVESYGIIVTLADRIRGLCPCVHLGELEVKKPHSKFKPGAAVRCHVLSVDVANSRVILTMKKSLCTSQLPRITTFSDANVGSVYEGYISAIKEAGCIVSFFNGVHGLAPKSKLGVSGINSGELQPDDCFRVGQTLKVKVLSCSPEQGKMLLTPDLSAVPAEGKIRCQDLVGKTVAGIVTKKAANKLEFQLDVDGLAEGTIGTIDEQHVSDHAEFCTEVLQTFEVGQKVNQMLVLKASGLNKRITLTLKPCLLAAAVSEAIPSSIDALVVGVTYPGYVSNVTDFGVFVRFGSSLTGLAMRGNVADEFVSDPAQHFSVGQSVQARVLKVDSSTKKFELSLKQSHCKAATDSFLRSYFADVCTIAGVSRRRSAFGWYSALKIGGTVEGVVEDMRYGGVIIDLGNDLTGFVKEEHCPDSTPCTVGDKVKARVLDADPRKAIVDLSLLPELLKQASKKRSVKAGSALRGTVQLVKSDYAVLTLDKSGIVCLANCKDYNARSINSQSLYKYGSSLTVQITSKTGTKSTDSPHATVPLATIMTESVTQSRKRQKKFDLQNDLSSLADVRVGMRTTGQIHKIHKNHMSVILGPKIPGRVHITEAVNEEHAKNGQNVFGDYQVGQQVTTRVLAVVTDHGQTYVDLSLRASTLQSDEIQHRASLQSLSRGQTFLAPIQKVQADALWVCLSQAVKGRVAAVDAVESVSKGQSMLDLFQAGSLLRCRVMEVNTDKKTVDLSAVDSSKLSPGCKCVGIVTKIRDGDAMYVRLPGLRHGRVHITDVHDVGVEYPFQNYRLGQLLECAVVAVNTEKDQLDLSVKSSHLSGSGDSAAIEVKDFKQGQRVHGYVRSISKQGCFVNLTRSLVGRVILRELSDSFVADLTGQFPVGKLVSATVTNVSLDSGKVDLSLKSSAGGNGSDKYSFDSLEVGQKYRCTVRRIESFGMFLAINKSSCVGLCHKSEVADKPSKDFAAQYSTGDYVQAVVLKLNPAKKQISLGLKPSYFETNDSDDDERGHDDSVSESNDELDAGVPQGDSNGKAEAMQVEEQGDEASAVQSLDSASALDVDEDFAVDLGLQAKLSTGMSSVQDSDDGDEASADDVESESEDEAEPDDVESEDETSDDEASEASEDKVPEEPDTNSGDDATEHADSDDTSDSDHEESSSEDESVQEVTAEEDEKRVRQREDALADPTVALMTDADYQREVIATPNNSVSWIKYMAFQLSIGEVDKAREVVQKALKTISFRNESEKQNVWVASLNLEKQYGTKATLMQMFERAILYNDPKPIYTQMVDIHKRSADHSTVEDLYKVMVRKFKNSPEVWCAYGAFQLERGEGAEAKKILERSLSVLDRSKHVSVISKFGENEFKLGNKERGRTYFESVIENAARRVDVWSVYLDMEIKYGDKDKIARLFDRATSMNLSTKKMKFLFKKHLEYAKAMGDAKAVETVKAKARAYVEAKTAA